MHLMLAAYVLRLVVSKQEVVILQILLYGFILPLFLYQPLTVGTLLSCLVIVMVNVNQLDVALSLAFLNF